MKQFFKFLLASCLGTIIALAALVIILMGIGSAIALSSGPSTTIGENQVLHLKINDNIPERTDNVQNMEFPFSPFSVLGVRDMALMLKKAADDPKIKGLFIDVGYYSPGQSTSLALRRAIDTFKLSGKWVYAYGNGYSQGGYYLASTADSVFIHKNGNVDFRGFAAFIPFFKEFLDNIGLDFEIYYAGDFKSATEPFRRNDMSEQNRLQLSEYIHEAYDMYLKSIGVSREMNPSELRELANNFRVQFAEDAFRYGLVDGIGSREDVYAKMGARMELGKDQRISLLVLEKYYLASKPKKNYSADHKIALVFAEGEINDAVGEVNGVIQGDRYAKILRKIRNDDKIKAVVLRVNSPGGSVMASAKILHEIKGIQAAGKKVVVSMGDYAASGGYYISCFADKIYAEPNTLTGSIGVYAMVPALDELLNDKLGIRFDTVGTGAYSTRFSPFFDWDEREDNYMQASTDRQYELFLQEVAQGRNMTRDQVHEVAQGRIWSGASAINKGLVDELGGLEQAIRTAQELAGIEEYRIEEFPYIKDQLTLFIEQMTGEKELTTRLSKAFTKQTFGEYAEHAELLLALKNQTGIQARLPIVIKYD
jgi:protease IV